MPLPPQELIDDLSKYFSTKDVDIKGFIKFCNYYGYKHSLGNVEDELKKRGKKRKLSLEQEKEILEKSKFKTQKEIGIEYNINQSYVSHIINRQKKEKTNKIINNDKNEDENNPEDSPTLKQLKKYWNFANIQEREVFLKWIE